MPSDEAQPAPGRSLDAVIGAAFSYGEAAVRPFLQSLRLCGYRGAIYLLVDEATPISEAYLAHFAAQRVVVGGAAFESQPPQQSRYWGYRLLLDRIEADRVLLSDVRDVLFQGDPFDFDWWDAYRLFFALEEGVIADCPLNTAWILARYGGGVLKRLGGYVSSCAGTVIGTRAAIGDYVDRICSHLEGASGPLALDQAVHNYICYLDPIDGQKTMLNGRGPILTLGGMRRFYRSPDGKIANYDLTVPHVVHLYDRLAPEVAGQFDYWNTFLPAAVTD